MKKIIIYLVSIIALIIVQYFLSIVMIFQIATKRVDNSTFGFNDGIIVVIWLGGIVSIIYLIIKFLVSIYRYK